ncbi:cytochrome P460 family protein [Tunturiibacter gelidiferens]|uniref:cytochrome P460 family protein n=1 Tax=Tunturiibacter gelidiferens TaxID=3069689 RepID=UPI003D9ADE96
MTAMAKLAIAALLITTIAADPQPDKKGGAAFTKDGDLVLPTGYRSWVFIGGPITPNGLNDGNAQFPEFHSVYVQKENFQYYQKNGKFPDGTVMAKELSLVLPGGHADGSLDSASGRGYFPSSLSGLDVMVKDAKRFGKTNDWGFFTFGHHAQPYEPVAKERSSKECASCHIAFVSKTDMVWVQYYPLLKANIE